MSGIELSLALLGVVREINGTVSRVRKTLEAPKEAEALLGRLFILQQCLSDFSQLHKAPDGGRPGGKGGQAGSRALDQLTCHVQALERPIREIHDGLSSTSKFKRGWHKFKYFRSPEMIREHEETLSRHVTSMQAILTTFTAYGTI
jgi:hypothetical protein